MECDAETHIGIPRRLLPLAHEITLRAQTRRVPLLVFRVPHVELVVVHALYDQETRPRITIEVDQSRPPYNARGMRNCVILNLYKYIN